MSLLAWMLLAAPASAAPITDAHTTCVAFAKNLALRALMDEGVDRARAMRARLDADETAVLMRYGKDRASIDRSLDEMRAEQQRLGVFEPTSEPERVARAETDARLRASCRTLLDAGELFDE